jgi:cytochrome c peroxidase
VKKENDGVVSQFGDHAPSDDPLVVAVHLPFVEIREMIVDDDDVERRFKREAVGPAQALYAALVQRLIADTSYAAGFASVFRVQPEDVRFSHVAEAIATFIRHRFALTETRFVRFLRGSEELGPQEVAGGLLFYGKDRCASCHSGPYFSDFAFHAVPLAQIGFGKNGFGVDYGRFNATHDPADLYRFRTPPLINVTKTKPYGHSGAVYDLGEAITAHFDPLGTILLSGMDSFARHELYKRLLAGAPNLAAVSYLDAGEVEQLKAFLGTLTLLDR